MIENLYDANLILYAIIAVCALGTMLKLVLACGYRTLIKEADNMEKSRNKNIRKIKENFCGQYEKTYTFGNIGVYVDKCILGMKIAGVRLSAIESVGTIFLLLCLLIGSVGTIWVFVYDKGKEQLIMHALEGVIAGGVLVLLDALINLQKKKEHLHINICNHLENYIKPRLECGEYNYRISELTKLSDEIDEGMMALINSMNVKENEVEKNENNNNIINISKTEQEIVEDVIKEYLT